MPRWEVAIGWSYFISALKRNKWGFMHFSYYTG